MYTILVMRLHIAIILSLVALAISWQGLEWVERAVLSPGWSVESAVPLEVLPAPPVPRVLFTPELLRAIHLVETDGDCQSVGDTATSYPAYGCFQIRLGLHPGVSRACAESYQCSSAYLVRFLTSERERLGLSDDDTIRRWNGLPRDRSNLGYVVRVKSKLATL